MNQGLLNVALKVFILFSIYSLMGVAIGSYRSDELYFMQTSWMESQGLDSVLYLPILLNTLLELYWKIFDYKIEGMLYLRSITISQILVQWILIYKIISLGIRGASVNARYWRLDSLALSIAYVGIIAAFRGYEVRPEMFVNTIFLLYGWWLISGNENQGKFKWILLMALILALACSLSFRAIFPAFFMWFLLIYQIVMSKGSSYKIHKILILTIVPALLVMLINYEIILNYHQYMGKIVAYSEDILDMGLYSKFTVGAWPGYGFLMVLFLVLMSTIVWSVTADGNITKYSKFKLWIIVSALFSFYCFVGFFDSNPRGYMQSIHWVLLIILLFYMLTVSHVIKNQHLNKLKFFIYIFSLGSAYLLNQDRNPEFHIKNIATHIAGEVESKQENYIQQVGWDSSIYMQYKSRNEFCQKFNGYNVLAYSIDYHPICLNDVGSFYFSTWGGESLKIGQVARNKPLVVISHDDGKLKEFKKVFGSDFKIYGFYGLLESKHSH